MEEPAGSEFRVLGKYFPFGKHRVRRAAGGARSCRRWFVAQYSDYRDDRLDADARADMIAHMAECASCRRYDRVIRRGVAVLGDAVARDEGMLAGRGGRTVDGIARTAVRRSDPVASGIAVASTFLVIALNAASSWGPAFARPAPQAEAPPEAAAEPPPVAAPATFPPRPVLRTPPAHLEPGDLGGERASPRIRVPVAVRSDPA